MTFRVGQKVVCVDHSEKWGCAYVHGLREGEVYEIAAIVAAGPSEGYLSVTGICSAWNPRRFRPAVERKTDISIFTAMLNPSKRRVSA